MTLPLSGPMSNAMISVELGNSSNSKLGLGDAAPRQLANKPSGAVSAFDFYGKQAVVPPLLYVGVSSVALMTSAVVQTLPSMTPVLPKLFDLTASTNQFMYWASPITLGYVKFYDTESMFTGGWDGAHDDYVSLGPITLTVLGVQYYVYRTDYPNLGHSYWEARFDPSPYY